MAQTRRRLCSAAVAADLPPPVGTAGRYSAALYNAATKTGTLDIVINDVESMQMMCKTNADLDEFLRNPSLPRSAKVDALMEIMAKAKFSKTFTQFMMVVAENGRTAESERILQSFQEIIASIKGEVVVKVTSTMELSEWELALLKKKIKERFFEGKPDADLTVETAIDPELLGGLTIQVGDRFMDLSTRTELRKLQDVILKSV